MFGQISDLELFTCQKLFINANARNVENILLEIKELEFTKWNLLEEA